MGINVFKIYIKSTSDLLSISPKTFSYKINLELKIQIESILFLTSPSRPRSVLLRLLPPPPLRAAVHPPAAPPTHPQRVAGLGRGWRSGLPSWRLGWGWWPCGTTQMNPVNTASLKEMSLTILTPAMI